MAQALTEAEQIQLALTSAVGAERLQQVLMSDAATSPQRPRPLDEEDDEKQGAAKRQKQPEEEKKIVNDVYLARCWEVGTDDGRVKIGKNGTLWLKSVFKFDVRFPTDKLGCHIVLADTPFQLCARFEFAILGDAEHRQLRFISHANHTVDEYEWTGRDTRANGPFVPTSILRVVDGTYVFSMSVTAAKQFNWMSETACWIPRVAFGRKSHGNDPTVREPCYISSSLINDDGAPIAVHPYQVEFNAPALAIALRRAYTVGAQRDATGRVTWMLDAPSGAIQAFLKAVLTGDYARWFYDVDGKVLDAELCDSVMLLADHWLRNPLGKGLLATPLYSAMRDTLPRYVKACDEPMDKARVLKAVAWFSAGSASDAIGDALDKAADECMSDEESDDESK